MCLSLSEPNKIESKKKSNQNGIELNGFEWNQIGIEWYSMIKKTRKNHQKEYSIPEEETEILSVVVVVGGKK